MNIFVCVKQVPATDSLIRIASNGNGIDTTNMDWIMSPYDEFALEEAVLHKEREEHGWVTALSAGPSRVIDVLRSALSLGADEAIHIEMDEAVEGNLTALALSRAISNAGKVDIVYTGREAIDDGAAQVSQMVAEHLRIPCVTAVVELELKEKRVVCRREVDQGSIEIIETELPAVIAAQKGLNEPRYPSVPNILKASRKEISSITLESLGLTNADQKIGYKNFKLPRTKVAGCDLVGDPEAQVKELVRLLIEEAKVI